MLFDPFGFHLTLDEVAQIQRVALGVLPQPLRTGGVDGPAEDVFDEWGDFRER